MPCAGVPRLVTSVLAATATRAPLAMCHWHSSCDRGEDEHWTGPTIPRGNPVGARVAAVDLDRDEPGFGTLPARLRQRRHGAHATAGVRGAARNADSPAETFDGDVRR